MLLCKNFAYCSIFMLFASLLFLMDTQNSIFNRQAYLPNLMEAE